MDGNPINLTDVRGDKVGDIVVKDKGNGYGIIEGENGGAVHQKKNKDGEYVTYMIDRPVEILNEKKQTKTKKNTKESIVRLTNYYKKLKEEVEKFRKDGEQLVGELDHAIKTSIKDEPQGEIFDWLRDWENWIVGPGVNLVNKNGGENGAGRRGTEDTEILDISEFLEYAEAMAPKGPGKLRFKGKWGKFGKFYNKFADFKEKVGDKVEEMQKVLDKIQKLNDELHVLETADGLVDQVGIWAIRKIASDEIEFLNDSTAIAKKKIKVIFSDDSEKQFNKKDTIYIP